MKSIPVVPKGIINAIRDRKLILLVGAGVSKLFGKPLWKELADMLFKECEKHTSITKSELIIIKQSQYTAMQQVTIACSLLDKQEKGLGLKTICKILDDKSDLKDENIKRIAKIFAKLNCPILTTNADNVLDDSGYFPKDCIYTNLPLNFKIDELLGCLSLIHIHGSTVDPKQMVFTAPQYLKYYNPTSPFGETLSKILPQDDSTESTCLLCIGYGANEFELLRYLVKAKKPKAGFKMFILNGYYNYERFRIKIDKQYFRSINFKNISYSLEEYDYENLINVLEEWYKQIDEMYSLEFSKIEDLEKLVSKRPNIYSVRKVKTILDTDLVNQLYSPLLASPYLDEWIINLKDFKRLFSAELNFLPAAKHNDGYRSSIWGGLEILVECLKRRTYNPEVLEVCEKILNDSLHLILSKEDVKSVKSICSSSSIMHNILRLATLNSRLFNNFDFVSFAKIYADAPFDGIDTVFYYLFKNSNYSSFDKNKIFEVIDYSIGRAVSSTKDKYHFELEVFQNEKFNCEIIDANSNQYFEMAQKFIKKYLAKHEDYFDMNSFALYPDTFGMVDVKAMPLMIFRRAAVNLSFEKAELFYKMNILSESRVLRKAAIYVLLFNAKLRDACFFKTDFSDIELLPDLFIYLDSMQTQIISNKNLLEFICRLQEIKFDDNDHVQNAIMKKLNSYLIGTKEYKNLDNFTDTEKNKIKNLTRRIYVSDGFEIAIKYDFENKTFNEINDYYTQNVKKDSFYKYDFLRKFSAYFENKHDFIVNNFDNFMLLDPEIICHFGDDKLMKEKLFTFDEQILYLKKAKKVYKENVLVNNLIIDLFPKLCNSQDVDDKEILTISNLIDIKKITFDSALLEEKTKSPITFLINIRYCRYLSALSFFALNHPLIISNLKSAVENLIKNCKDEYISKTIIAYCFPCIYHVEPIYADSLLDYTYDNVIGKINYSFLASMCSGYFHLFPAKLLNSISCCNEFLHFTRDKYTGEVLYGKEIYSSYLCYEYYIHNNKRILKLLSTINDIEVYKICFKLISENWINEKYYLKINAFLDETLKSLKNNKNLIGESDFLMRIIAELILKTDDNFYKLWDILLVISKNFNDYFSDGMIDIVKKYKNSHAETISNILDNVFHNCGEWFVYKEDNLVEIISLILNDDFYNNKIHEWVSLLRKKNHRLKLPVPKKIK